MVTLTLPVGIDATADPAFALVARITGPNNAYLDHIAAQTGASVTLRGAGTGVAEGEATAVHFAAPRVPVLNAAAGLVTSLLDTIRGEWRARGTQQHPPAPMPPPGRGAYNAVPPPPALLGAPARGPAAADLLPPQTHLLPPHPPPPPPHASHAPLVDSFLASLSAPPQGPQAAAYHAVPPPPPAAPPPPAEPAPRRRFQEFPAEKVCRLAPG